MPKRTALGRSTVRRMRSNVWPPVAAGLTALAAVEIAQSKWDALPPLGRIAFVALVLGPLPLIRSAPTATVTTMIVSGDALLLLFGAPRSLALFFVVWLAAFATALYAESVRRRLLLLALIASLVVVSEVQGSGGWAWSDFTFSVMLFAFSVATGSALRAHNRRSSLAEEAAARAHEHAAHTAREAAISERARIARDLHDIVAHGVSLMVVQAAAAANVLDQDTDGARTMIRAIESSGQRTLGELRRMLDVMRDDTAAPALPQPGLASLEELAAETRRSGTPVDLSIDLAGASLPAGVDVAAYRIVQEALTNARRHAPGAQAEVRVSFEAGELRLEVVNRRGGRVAPGHRPGHGLDGMRERAALYGGRIDVGPTDDGGWRVLGRLPVESPAPVRPTAADPGGGQLALDRTAP